MEDHYFGALKDRVSAYMRDLDEELWKLGVLAKTEHNEAARPSTSWPRCLPPPTRPATTTSLPWSL